MRILTVNVGSTSLKLERYDLSTPAPRIAQPSGAAYTSELSGDVLPAALRAAIGPGVDMIAHRFVQLPPDAAAVTALDALERQRIREAGADDHQHDDAALRAVETIDNLVPGVPQYAISDSAFHRTMSAAATTYALPREITGTMLHRIGYHGLSHEYAAHRGCALADLDVRNARVITAHLGGGSSLCAILDGKSIDTTMGFTPLEGVPMATRSGSVDPGILLHLLRGGMTPDALGTILERRSGLAGISGLSGDMRELLAAPDSPAAVLAIDVLAWRIRSAIGALMAVLGGTDLIVFTGGIGEHAAPIRAAAIAGGLGIGAAIDPAKNAVAGEGRIDAASPVAIAVVTAREGWQLARTALSHAREAQ